MTIKIIDTLLNAEGAIQKHEGRVNGHLAVLAQNEAKLTHLLQQGTLNTMEGPEDVVVLITVIEQ